MTPSNELNPFLLTAEQKMANISRIQKYEQQQDEIRARAKARRAQLQANGMAWDSFSSQVAGGAFASALRNNRDLIYSLKYENDTTLEALLKSVLKAFRVAVNCEADLLNDLTKIQLFNLSAAHLNKIADFFKLKCGVEIESVQYTADAPLGVTSQNVCVTIKTQYRPKLVQALKGILKELQQQQIAEDAKVAEQRAKGQCLIC
jgi:hypothetical protein